MQTVLGGIGEAEHIMIQLSPKLLALLTPGRYNITIRVDVYEDDVVRVANQDTKQIYPPLADEYDLDVMRDYYLAHGYIVVERK